MQTSINTIVVMAMDCIRERHGMTGQVFSKWIDISPSSWSKATKGQATISVESIHKVLRSYRHEGAAGLSEFFGVIENIVGVISADRDDHRSVLVRSNNLTLDKMWDSFLQPKLLSHEVIEVIRHYKTNSRSKLNLFNMEGNDDLFRSSVSYLFAQDEDYLAIDNYINELPWYEKNKKDPDWIISLKEKVKEKMRMAMRVDAEISALQRKGEDKELIASIREMTRLSMTHKVIGKNGEFSDSDAQKEINKMKANFHREADNVKV